MRRKPGILRYPLSLDIAERQYASATHSSHSFKSSKNERGQIGAVARKKFLAYSITHTFGRAWFVSLTRPSSKSSAVEALGGDTSVHLTPMDSSPPSPRQPLIIMQLCVVEALDGDTSLPDFQSRPTLGFLVACLLGHVLIVMRRRGARWGYFGC